MTDPVVTRIPRAAWLGWTLLAVGCWGVWAILSRLIGDALSATQSQALSTLGILPVIFALARRPRPRPAIDLNTRRGCALALGAGVLTCIGNAGYYDVLNRGTKAATVVPLTALYPLVTIVLAIVILRERIHRVQGLGLVGSLAALYLFNIPGEQGLASPALRWVFLPIAMWGVAGLLQKVATNHVPGERAAFWFLAAFVPVAAVILWREPTAGPYSARTWILASALGLFFALGNLALLQAFARGGKASVVAPIASLYPLVSIPIALLLFHEQLSGRETAAIFVAIVSVVALAWERPSHPDSMIAAHIRPPIPHP